MSEEDRDERTETDLYSEIVLADWNVRSIGHVSSGVVLSFRKHYTSDYAGMETREVGGKDVADAYRKFLAELKAEGQGH